MSCNFARRQQSAKSKCGTRGTPTLMQLNAIYELPFDFPWKLHHVTFVCSILRRSPVFWFAINFHALKNYQCLQVWQLSRFQWNSPVFYMLCPSNEILKVFRSGVEIYSPLVCILTSACSNYCSSLAGRMRSSISYRGTRRPWPSYSASCLCLRSRGATEVTWSTRMNRRTTEASEDAPGTNPSLTSPTSSTTSSGSCLKSSPRMVGGGNYVIVFMGEVWDSVRGGLYL